MKKITITFPDEIQEEEIIPYLRAAFDNSASGFRKMEKNNEPNNIVYANNTKAVLTRNKAGYTLKFTEFGKPKEEEKKEE